MEKRKTLDVAVQSYDEARPSYPDDVINWIISITKVSTDKRLLEIGSGTGQATIKFAEKGYGIDCIEPSENLAEILRQKVDPYDVSVNVDAFETWKPEDGFRTPFIFSATAFHRLDANVKYEKCRDFLEEKGYLVLLWNEATEKEIPEVRKAFDLLSEYHSRKETGRKTRDGLRDERSREIRNSGLFDLEYYFEHKWNTVQTREAVTKGFLSQSHYLSLDEEKRVEISPRVEELFDGLDDAIETELYTTVYIARKK